ncbi:hypothetical protein TNCV_1445711 [Trichonephila clavipes]|nr:hypothetical protein TNCV_1445711 [Trichonephila clavipes]
MFFGLKESKTNTKTLFIRFKSMVSLCLEIENLGRRNAKKVVCVWTIENRFTLFTNAGRQRIRPKQQEVLQPDCMQPVMEAEGKGLMIWEAFGWNGIGSITTI